MDTSLPSVLNQLFGRFENQQGEAATHAAPPENEQPLVFHGHQVRSTQNWPPNWSPKQLIQTYDIFTNIFNLSLQRADAPTCFKSSTIVPVPKKSEVLCWNDWWPAALAPIIMKCFERLIILHIKTIIPPDLGHQFPYRANRSMENMVSSALQIALTHLEHIHYVRMLFVGFSSVFNPIVPHKLVNNLRRLGLETPQCSRIMDFLTNKPQNMRIGDCTLSTLILSATRVCPQPCPLLPVYIWLHPKTPLQHNSQVCDWHHCCGSDFRQQWDDLQGAGAKPGKDHRDFSPKFKIQEITADLKKTWRSTHSARHIHGDEMGRVESFKFHLEPPHPEYC